MRRASRIVVPSCIGLFAATVSAGVPTATLDFSTYFGGAGDLTLREIAFDSTGNIPVAKFAPDGTLLWATIIGGSGKDRVAIVGFDVAIEACGLMIRAPALPS